MVPVISYATLTEVATEARPYPTEVLEGCETGLCLFSAAFLGHNEAIHFALAEVRTTCVDIDSGKLAEIERLYPSDWEFVHADAWKFAEDAADAERTWDVVSVDTFRGNATEKSLVTIPLWCSIANKAVVMTLEKGQDYDVPMRWRAELLARNSEVYWLILTRKDEA